MQLSDIGNCVELEWLKTQEIRKDMNVKLGEWIVMPDHFHALLTPGPTMALERAVQFIKGGSARRIAEKLPSRLPIWQRGFSDHRVRDPGDYATHLRYIEQNPVKRRFVSTPAEYAWSSASGRYPLDEVHQGLKPLSQ